jgi:hypothetical protein
LGIHRIHPDVASDARLLVVVADPVIAGLALPESFARPLQEQIGLSRSVAFAAFEDLAQREVWNRPQDDMDVVGHDNPIIQQILFVVKFLNCETGPAKAGN